MKYPLSEERIFHYRPKPFFFITTNDRESLSYENLYASLKELKDAGFGGIVLFNKPQSGFNEKTYLGDDFFYMVENACKACKDLGLETWINDAYDFPPGAVAGRIEKIAPHLKPKHIKLIDGVPTVLEADWGFPAFEEPLAGELFRKLVYEEYYKRVGKYFGDPIKGFFSDTDNRRVQPSAMFDENSPMRDYFPWSTDFERDFKAEYGYDIMPFMKDILLRKNLKQAEDYWEFAGRLYQRWWKGNAEWIHAHGLEYTGHSGDTSPYLQTEAPRSSCFTEGRFSDAQSYFDYPGTDHELYAIDCGKHMVAKNMYMPKEIWGETLVQPKMTKYADVSEDMRPKQAGATAFLLGRKGVMCEMFAASNFGVEPRVLKHISSFQLMQGVTFAVVSEYNHRFLGEVKYFAPPDYCKHSTLKYSMDVLCKEMAETAYMMEKGKSVYPVALIDPTEYVWRNDYDKTPYLDAFARLNRKPYGFTICDVKRLTEKDYGFKVAIFAGIKLPAETIRAIEKKGIKVLPYERLDETDNYVYSPAVYKGEGTPHFSRKIIDDEEFTFIANIESEKPIKGNITAYGKSKDILLYPGDIRYISERYDDIPSPETKGEFITKLPAVVPVSFEKPNIIQMEYFTGENGKAVIKTEKDEKITFTFTAKDVIPLKLYIPKNCKNKITGITFNGVTPDCKDGYVFDEEYDVYDIKNTVIGKNVISITKTSGLDYYDRLLIEGEFNAFIKTDKTLYKNVMTLYNIAIYIPEKAEITLSKRTETLAVGISAAVQGQPFYSGGITYTFDIDVKEGGNYRLKFDRISDAGYLTVNGKFTEKIVKPPYSYLFPLNAGKNRLELTVYNTMANAMENYLEDGGITSEGILEKLP